MTEEEVKKIYQEEYIDKHIGGCSLSKKYSCDLYNLFKKYNLPMRNNKEKNKKYTCNVSYFKQIDSEKKAYWLGFIMADGYIGVNNGNKRFGISINVNDINHLYNLKNELSATNPINTYRVSQGYKIGTEYCRLIITEEHLVEDLIKQGCVEHKSNILQPPNIEKSLRKHWIRGFMDGNGSIVIHNTQYGDSFSISFTSTDNVLNWIMDELIEDEVLERRYPLDKRKQEQIVSEFSFGGNDLVKKYCDYIYKDATVYLQRKYDRYVQLQNIIINRDNKKIKHCCDICRKHYEQLDVYGKITDNKKGWHKYE